MGDNNKPFLKWAGGKTRLSDFIAGHFPGTCRHRLNEPFAGSAALSCMLEFDHYCLSDVNPDLMSVYASLKEHGQDFIDYARSFFTLQNNHKDRFHALRTTFNQRSMRARAYTRGRFGETSRARHPAAKRRVSCWPCLAARQDTANSHPRCRDCNRRKASK